MIDTNRPVPAAIDGRRWSVAPTPGDLSGATDMRSAKMFAPVTDTPTARMIRNHELCHARITPRQPAAQACKRHGISMEALQWSEDSRISSFLDSAGLVDDEALSDDECAMIVKAIGTRERAIAGAFLVNWELGVQVSRLQGAFTAAGVPEPVVAAIWDRVNMIRGTACDLALGRTGRRRGRRPSWRKIFADPAGFLKFTIPLAREFDREFPESGGDDGGNKPGPEDAAAARRLASIKGRGRWGRLLGIGKPAASRAVRPRRAPGRRYSDTGVIPSAVHRLPTDGAVFTARRRSKGGTVLCDASGSMHYSDADIERLLQEAPGSTVAFYAGRHDHRSNPGRIVIGAAGGRAAAVKDIRAMLPGGDNIVDGPALRWLARQPAPRFWITDEAVGGISDFGVGGDCWRECREICAAANIRIVPTIDALRR